jgi:tetratricopeptide (TPR) repeat protein
MVTFCQFVSTSIVLAGAASIPQQIVQLEQEAKLCMESRDFAGARSKYLQIIGLAPGTENAMVAQSEIAVSYIRSSQFSTATPEIQALLSKYNNEPNIAQAVGSVAFHCFFNNQHASARSLFEQAITDWPDHPRTIWHQSGLGRVLIRMEDYEAAEKVKNTLLKEYVGHPEINQAIGDMALEYVYAGQHAIARPLLEQVLASCRACSGSIWYQNAMIQTMIRLGDGGAAEQIAGTLLQEYRNNPDFIPVMLQVCETFQQTNDFGKTLELCSRVSKLYPQAEQSITFQNLKARCYYELGSLEQAHAAIETITEQYANSPGASKILRELADMCRSRGECERSLRLDQLALEKATTLEDRLYAYGGLGRDYVRLENHARVQDVLQKMIVDFKDESRLSYNTFMIGEEYYIRAQKIGQAGDQQQMHDDFAKALAIWRKNINQIADPEHQCLAYYYSAVAYQNMDQMDTAIEYYNEVVTRWPDYEKAWYAQYMIAKSYESLMRQQKASSGDVRSAYQMLLEKYPDCSAAKIASQKLDTL